MFSVITPTYNREHTLERVYNSLKAQTFRNSGNFLANVYWGSKFRLRFLSTDIIQPNFDIMAIPGYGKTLSNVVPSVNFFIKYRIDL